ncbi:LacI family DNA-binding transcriptional regulator [Psychromicrobium xiongbiense]|uniref:LacI family DNA-binding transcriptional regulator n=1 Tax=Psychromicrobium xiongbiense TaxID=3051184 RepID=UPI0025554CA2|nr:LacI family DNA-binding transcriptional regulator [Psychromicrobium sp. YIM S02556]
MTPSSLPRGDLSRHPTVLDVAEAAGVSRQTVSNVLNNPEVVKAKTRERVDQAIAALAYQPHASARRLRTRQSSTIGIRLDHQGDGISGGVLDRYLHALTEFAAARSMRILLYTAADAQDEIRQFQRLLDGADVDAFALTATHDGDPRTRWLREHGANFVTFGRPWGEDDIDDPVHRWVDVDGADGTSQATEHLWSQGKRRIAYLGWPRTTGTDADRYRGWERTMIQHGVPASELEVLHWISSEMVSDAQQVVECKLAEVAEQAGTAESRSKGLARVDGIVCASDTLALGALMAVRNAGRPEVPVVGFDNSSVALALGFSSVDQNLDDVGQASLELLLGPTAKGAGAEPTAAHRLIRPTLVVRHG